MPEDNPYAQMYQEGMKKFTPVTTPPLTPPSALETLTTPQLHSIPTSFGGAINELGKGQQNVRVAAGNMIAHPWETMKGMARMTPAVAAFDAARGKPTAYQEAGESFMQHPIETGESMAGQGALLDLVGAGVGAVPKIGDYLRPKSSPSIVPPEETNSAHLAQSILPPGGIKPEFLRNLQTEVPAVKAYATRTGNPLNTQAEGLKAAQGVAQEGLQHFNENFLKPYENEHVDLPQGLSPELKTSTTIGQMNQRLSDINDMMRGAQASAKSAGEAMSAQERLGLENEAKGLRQRLYDEISRRAGVAGPDIRDLREGYGGEFGLANQLEAAQNARLTRTGQESQGQVPFGAHRPTIWDAPLRLLNSLRGGEEAIADRQFSSRLKPFTSAEPLRPTPNPQPPNVAMPGKGGTPSGGLREPSFFTSDAGAQMDMSKPLNGPMRPVSETPSLARDLKISREYEAEGNARYQAGQKAGKLSDEIKRNASKAEGEYLRNLGRQRVIQRESGRQ